MLSSCRFRTKPCACVGSKPAPFETDPSTLRASGCGTRENDKSFASRTGIGFSRASLRFDGVVVGGRDARKVRPYIFWLADSHSSPRIFLARGPAFSLHFLACGPAFSPNIFSPGLAPGVQLCV